MRLESTKATLYFWESNVSAKFNIVSSCFFSQSSLCWDSFFFSLLMASGTRSKKHNMSFFQKEQRSCFETGALREQMIQKVDELCRPFRLQRLLSNNFDVSSVFQQNSCFWFDKFNSVEMFSNDVACFFDTLPLDTSAFFLTFAVFLSFVS
jgi:hypothetical protein